MVVAGDARLHVRLQLEAHRLTLPAPALTVVLIFMALSCLNWSAAPSPLDDLSNGNRVATRRTAGAAR